MIDTVVIKPRPLTEVVEDQTIEHKRDLNIAGQDARKEFFRDVSSLGVAIFQCGGPFSFSRREGGFGTTIFYSALNGRRAESVKTHGRVKSNTVQSQCERESL